MKSTARPKKKRIVIFASGSGTNAQNIIRYFKERELAEVVLVLSNRRSAGVLEKAREEEVEALHFSRSELYEEDRVKQLLKKARPDLIVLAGFLLKFPESLLRLYPDRVINIHPALLPKYGGKGMYGMHVHEAVVANREAQSGITIHYVNEAYDEGAIVFQQTLQLKADETPESLAGRIHQLEYAYFPPVIERLLQDESPKIPLNLDPES